MKFFKSLVLVILFSFVLSNKSFAYLSYYKCVFDRGSSSDFDNTPSPEKIKVPLKLVFEDLDYNNNSGRMVGENGSAEIGLITTGNINIIEVTPSGNMTVTTIFLNPKNTYNAVHSRHIDMFGAVVSQYYGICN